MVVVPLHLDEEIVSKVDALVRLGMYKNRSEALREQIKKGLDKISLLQDEFVGSELYDQLLERLLKLPEPPQLLKTEKTLTELVSEGRER